MNKILNFIYFKFYGVKREYIMSKLFESRKKLKRGFVYQHTESIEPLPMPISVSSCYIYIFFNDCM